MIGSADEVKTMRMIRLLTFLSLVLATLPGVGCGRETAQPESAPPTAAIDVYVVRGEVVELPDMDSAAGGFYVRHEAIEEFKAADGTVVGMDAMTMRFPLRDPALLDGISVGDKVELTYEVNWHGQPMQQATRVVKLPADTELNF
jgi:Cu/Ag efflux protein CusF